MKLAEYVATFHDFPDLTPVRPFLEWSVTCPTRSLAWYDAYNSEKHNREFEFGRATLRHAFEAVAGCIVVFAAQFGQASLGREVSSAVGLTVPEWPVSEMYNLVGTNNGWIKKNHPEFVSRD